jgi:hypothetical protein
LKGNLPNVLGGYETNVSEVISEHERNFSDKHLLHL